MTRWRTGTRCSASEPSRRSVSATATSVGTVTTQKSVISSSVRSCLRAATRSRQPSRRSAAAATFASMPAPTSPRRSAVASKPLRRPRSVRSLFKSESMNVGNASSRIVWPVGAVSSRMRAYAPEGALPAPRGSASTSGVAPRRASKLAKGSISVTSITSAGAPRSPAGEACSASRLSACALDSSPPVVSSTTSARASSSSRPGGGSSRMSAKSSRPSCSTSCSATPPSPRSLGRKAVTAARNRLIASVGSTSRASRRSHPGTGTGLPPERSCWSASPRECAGSVDATSVLKPASAQRTARAAEVDVFPTPPLPPTSTKRCFTPVLTSSVRMSERGAATAGVADIPASARGAPRVPRHTWLDAEAPVRDDARA
mmetsp:Transcript_1582/g.4450  ORF Transcript_1582/g.4450 Transcript_1582/m.4450 type:complete len:373 (+) Transcript_1582:1645-2763(+)